MGSNPISHIPVQLLDHIHKPWWTSYLSEYYPESIPADSVERFRQIDKYLIKGVCSAQNISLESVVQARSCQLFLFTPKTTLILG